MGNLAAGLCCRVGTNPGARSREEEEVILLMIAMVLIRNDDDAEVNIEEGGVPAAVDCLGMRGSALLSQLPAQAIRWEC